MDAPILSHSPVEVDSLDAIEKRLPERLERFRSLGRRTIEEAWWIGDDLRRAKALVDHSQWLPWLAKMGVEKRTAQRLLRLIVLYDMRQVVAYGSVDEALQTIKATPPAAPLAPGEGPPSQDDDAPRIEAPEPYDEPDEPNDGPAELQSPEPPAPHVHVAQASGNPEWYTPAPILQAARDALGVERFDLDPAASSDLAAQQHVGARYAITKDTDALSSDTSWRPANDPDWQGTVFLNPPYNTKLIQEYADRLLEEIALRNVLSAVWLSNNATETRWANELIWRARCVVFPIGRIKFLDATLQLEGSPLQGQMIVGLGDELNVDYFRRAFAPYGRVWR